MQKIGKGNSLLYALIVTGFLTWSSINIKYDKHNGWALETKPAPPLITTPCLILIGVGLGVNMLDILRTVVDVANRNSIAITNLTNKMTTLPIPQTQVNIIETEEKKELLPETIDENKT